MNLCVSEKLARSTWNHKGSDAGQDLLLKLYMAQPSWREGQESCTGSIILMRRTVLISWGISCRFSLCHLSCCWCCPSSGVCVLRLVQNEFTKRGNLWVFTAVWELIWGCTAGFGKKTQQCHCPGSSASPCTRGCIFCSCAQLHFALPLLSSCPHYSLTPVLAVLHSWCLLEQWILHLPKNFWTPNLSEPKIKFVKPIKTTAQTFFFLHAKYKLCLSILWKLQLEQGSLRWIWQQFGLLSSPYRTLCSSWKILVCLFLVVFSTLGKMQNQHFKSTKLSNCHLPSEPNVINGWRKHTDT